MAGELEGQSSTNLQRWRAPRSQTPNNLHLGTLPESQKSSQTAEESFDFGTASAAGLHRYLDSDPLNPDSSPEETVGLTLDAAVTPTLSCQLSLSLEILEGELVKQFLVTREWRRRAMGQAYERVHRKWWVCRVRYSNNYFVFLRRQNQKWK